MRWLADENIPGSVITHLRNLGHDVEAIAASSPGISDIEVIEKARSDKRLLLSFDRDHGDLIFAHAVQPPRAVVFLRLAPPDPGAVIALVDSVLALGEESLLGRFTVATRLGVRQRSLPAPLPPAA